MLQECMVATEESRPDLLVWFMRGGVVGLGAAVGLFLLSLIPVLGDSEGFLSGMDLLWPSAIVLVVEPQGFMAIVFLALALAINFVLYGLGALALALAVRLLQNLAALLRG